MPIFFNGSFGGGDPFLNRTGVTVATGPAFSGLVWVKLRTTTNNFMTCMYVARTSTWEMWLPETEGLGRVLMGFFPDGGAEIDMPGPTLVAGKWVCFGWYRDDSGRGIYIGSEDSPSMIERLDTTARTLPASNVMTSIYFGNDVFSEPLNGELAWGRLWQVKLTKAEFEAEMASQTGVAVKTASLRGDWELKDLATMTTDRSGNSQTLTASATLLLNGGAPPTPMQASTVITPTFRPPVFSQMRL